MNGDHVEEPAEVIRHVALTALLEVWDRAVV